MDTRELFYYLLLYHSCELVTFKKKIVFFFSFNDMATIYSVTVCDLDVDDTESKKPEKLCTLHCSTIDSGVMGCKIFEGNLNGICF